MRNEIRSYLTTQQATGCALEFSDSDSLLEAGVIDSMTMVGLMTHLEATYGIRISEEDMVPEHFDSVNAIAAYVERRIADDGSSLPMN